MCENPEHVVSESYVPEGITMTVVGAGLQIDKGRIAELAATGVFGDRVTPAQP